MGQNLQNSQSFVLLSREGFGTLKLSIVHSASLLSKIKKTLNSVFKHYRKLHSVLLCWKNNITKGFPFLGVLEVNL